VAKFQGDRSRDLGGNLAKEKKKHHEHFIRPPVTPCGRPKKYEQLRYFEILTKSLAIVYTKQSMIMIIHIVISFLLHRPILVLFLYLFVSSCLYIYLWNCRTYMPYVIALLSFPGDLCSSSVPLIIQLVVCCCIALFCQFTSFWSAIAMSLNTAASFVTAAWMIHRELQGFLQAISHGCATNRINFLLSITNLVLESLIEYFMCTKTMKTFCHSRQDGILTKA